LKGAANSLAPTISDVNTRLEAVQMQAWRCASGLRIENGVRGAARS
jgi:hypothetical protein